MAYGMFDTRGKCVRALGFDTRGKCEGGHRLVLCEWQHTAPPFAVCKECIESVSVLVRPRSRPPAPSTRGNVTL